MTESNASQILDYVWCPLNQRQKELLLTQIDVGSWKHSWHLPKKDFIIDWHNLKTVNAVRDVLASQIEEATKTLREADRCLKITVDALIEMEKTAND